MSESEILQSEFGITEVGPRTYPSEGEFYKFIAKTKPATMAIIGPGYARCIVKEMAPEGHHRMRCSGNSHQRRKYVRFFTRQRNQIIALSKLPDDSPERMLVRTTMPK